MQKYLLYNNVEPEELPTLKELSTIGKAPGDLGRSTASTSITWRGAVESPRLGPWVRPFCCKESPAVLCLGARGCLWEL